MKKINKKGFTLIELLAVIVILAILIAVAVPAITRYLASARANTFKDNALSALEAVRKEKIINGGTTTKYDLTAMKLANDLRDNISVQTNISSRSFNAQMKYANKINALYTIVIGEDEVNNNKCKIKNMKNGEEIEIELNADLISEKIIELEEDL